MKKLVRFISMSMIAIALIGCSTRPPPTVSQVEWQTQQQMLSRIRDYVVTGKMAYISPKQRQSFHFQWQHNGQRTQLRLTTFLGQTVLNLVTDPTGTQVTTYDDRVYQGKDASVLILQLTGLSIPVNELPDWLLGLPTHADSIELNSTNTLEKLQKAVNNDVWSVRYSQYNDQTTPIGILPLPNRIQLTQAQNKLTMVFNQWTVNR